MIIVFIYCSSITNADQIPCWTIRKLKLWLLILKTNRLTELSSRKLSRKTKCNDTVNGSQSVVIDLTCNSSIEHLSPIEKQMSESASACLPACLPTLHLQPVVNQSSVTNFWCLVSAATVIIESSVRPSIRSQLALFIMAFSQWNLIMTMLSVLSTEGSCFVLIYLPANSRITHSLCSLPRRNSESERTPPPPPPLQQQQQQQQQVVVIRHDL